MWAYLRVNCNVSTNHWLPVSVCAVWPVALNKISHHSCRMAVNSLSWIQHGTETGEFFFFFFLASQTLSAQTCTKWKQTQPRLLITIHLDLCRLFFSSSLRHTKWPIAAVQRQNQPPFPLVRGTAPCRPDKTCLTRRKPEWFFKNLLFHVQSYKLQRLTPVWYLLGHVAWINAKSCAANFTNCLSLANTFHWCGACSVTGS